VAGWYLSAGWGYRAASPWGAVAHLCLRHWRRQTDLGYTGQRNMDDHGSGFTIGLMDLQARMYDPYKYLGADAMSTSVLENRDFVLGLEENWDSYHETKVRFSREVIISGYTYYLFTENNTGKVFFLSPRYADQLIEGVIVEKRIVVNLFTGQFDADETEMEQPTPFATGLLLLPDQSLLSKDRSNL
jgi:hypothetical protein